MESRNLYAIVNNIALQVHCFGCKMQEPYLDEEGVLRCHKAEQCQHIIRYSKVEYQYPDPDFDDVTMGRCSKCGQMVYRPAEKTTCPCCGRELVWEKGGA